MSIIKTLKPYEPSPGYAAETEKEATPSAESLLQKSSSEWSDSTANSLSSQGVITLTHWSKQTGILTKRIYQDPDGILIKDGSPCKMSTGIGQKVKLQFHELPGFFKDLSTHHAICLGIPKNKNLPEQFNVMAAQKFKGQQDTITRSLEHIEWERNHNSVLFFDYDPAKDTDPLTPDELAATIADILPGFENAARVITHSTSSCISDENGQEITGASAGHHTYFIVPPGTDVKRLVEIIKVRTWIAGLGYIQLSKDGRKDLRNRIIDLFVFSPERLVFESGANIQKGWTQTRPEPVYVPGGIFDPATLPDLTDGEWDQYNILVDGEKLAIDPQAKEIRSKYIDVKANDLHARKQKIPLSVCRSTILKACSDGDLYGDFEIHLDSGEVVSVAEIRKTPWRYDGATCADPIEPGGTAGKAQIYMNIGKGNEKPVIKSFWHGDHILFLHREPAFDAEQEFRMQRKLISGGCPGFGFTAPIQSSGKTALCQAIIYSLHGRPAAATSYSDNDNEMAKHILGILQEGHSAILFDNIAEGSVIESNELAKVITSDTYSNRLLSKNKTITVPCSVLWLMTGNNISVCGDFNTRFPAWDRFVRLPLHKVSGIDIAEMFQKNKLSDPKIEGQNNFFVHGSILLDLHPRQENRCLINVAESTAVTRHFLFLMRMKLRMPSEIYLQDQVCLGQRVLGNG